MNLTHRSYLKELLDQDNIPFEDIQKNMQELNFINTFLGGHNISVSGLRKLLGKEKNVLICEIGCGGGDNIVALNKWCKTKNIKASFIGIDIKSDCIKFAKSRRREDLDVKWIVSDYEKVVFDVKPDIIFSSLFCHHFTNEDLIRQIEWQSNNCTLGFFINDLQRNKIAYYAIKLLTALFSSSYLVKNDAPLSVARGFKKHELQSIFKQAGIKTASIHWQWAFRYLVTYKHAADSL
jgi:2-polyprenyl-3-methyl-5-hydroxy-6-metoxy-1,4-benzoquinol methylase